MAAAALAGGLLLDQVVAAGSIAVRPGTHGMLPDYVGTVSAVALLAVLGVALVRPALAHRPAPTAAPVTLELAIAGMTCSHCVESVRRALLECPGVQSAQVHLASGSATIAGSHVDVERLRQAVESLGYKVKDIRQPPSVGTQETSHG
jgi:copper chaperone CopZ